MFYRCEWLKLRAATEWKQQWKNCIYSRIQCRSKTHKREAAEQSAYEPYHHNTLAVWSKPNVRFARAIAFILLTRTHTPYSPFDLQIEFMASKSEEFWFLMLPTKCDRPFVVAYVTKISLLIVFCGSANAQNSNLSYPKSIFNP